MIKFFFFKLEDQKHIAFQLAVFALIAISFVLLISVAVL